MGSPPTMLRVQSGLVSAASWPWAAPPDGFERCLWPGQPTLSRRVARAHFGRGRGEEVGDAGVGGTGSDPERVPARGSRGRSSFPAAFPEVLFEQCLGVPRGPRSVLPCLVPGLGPARSGVHVRVRPPETRSPVPAVSPGARWGWQEGAGGRPARLSRRCALRMSSGASGSGCGGQGFAVSPPPSLTVTAQSQMG